MGLTTRSGSAMMSAAMENDGRLFPYTNPLTERLGREFFLSLPRAPGVYLFRGEADSLLYVGKAKDLRARLNSYRRAHPDRDSRKVIRMVHLIRRVELETCDSEEAALLRENHLLRTLRPPFNVVNTHPDSYYLIGMKRMGHRFCFCLTTRESLGEPEERGSPFWSEADEEGSEGFTLFGAYKWRGSVRRAYSSLLRLLWMMEAQPSERFSLPGVLCRYSPPYRYSLSFSESASDQKAAEWESLLKRFLHGTSRKLLERLTEGLLSNDSIPPFYYHCIQEDLEALEAFYEFGPHRNQKLRRHHGLRTKRIGQEQIDDLLVTYRLAKK